MIKGEKHLARGFFFVAAGLLSFLLFVPSNIIKVDISNVLSATALLYSILIGFFITAAMNNHFQLQTLITKETGILINLYSFFKSLRPKKAKKMSDEIDSYLLKAFDNNLSEYTRESFDEFNAISDQIFSLKIDSIKDGHIFNRMVHNISEMRKIRQQVRVVAPKIIKPIYWMTLLILAGMLIGLLFMTCGTGFISHAVTFLLSLSVTISLILLEQVDSNLLDEENLVFNSFESVFDLIDKPRYFPDMYLRRKKIDIEDIVAKGQDYRVGFYVKNGSEKAIKLIKYGKDWTSYKPKNKNK